MLKLKRLTLNDFGPYKGEQVIDFPQDGGIVIVYGQNGRGKTSLLNAIRYAFFGKVVGRGSREHSLSLVTNWESAKAGKYGFKVVLEFESHKQQYELTRQYVPREGILVPQSDNDYVEEVILRCNGNVLSPADRDKRLSVIMPEQVSRFFLFDGELLQEYEELLFDESSMGEKIKESIERILGVPVLLNARTDLNEAFKNAQKRLSKAAQNDKATQDIGNLLENAQKIQEYHIGEAKKLTDKLMELQKEKTDLETKLKQTEKDAELIGSRSILKEQVLSLEKQLESKKEQLQELLNTAWQGMIRHRVEPIMEDIRVQIEKLEKKKTESLLSQNLLNEFTKGIESGVCPTCNEQLSEENIIRFKSEIAKQHSLISDDENQKLQTLYQKQGQLKSLLMPDKTERIKEIEDDISDKTVDIADKTGRINDIDKLLKGADEAVINKTKSRFGQALKEIGIVEDGIKKEELEVKNTGEKIKSLQEKLKKLSGGSALNEEHRKTNFYESLRDLFEHGVTKYRDLLKNKIEKDATEIFLKITSEPDYNNLQINSSYGLTIIHKDGQAIPIRSAGVEHTVALALMGALQKNAPLQGPIVMDSSFGRLDKIHRENLTNALPSMAEQVILLVYKEEIDQQTTRNILGGKLKKEYELVRNTAMYTTIEEMGG